jgi:hypothetical protein
MEELSKMRHALSAEEDK